MILVLAEEQDEVATAFVGRVYHRSGFFQYFPLNLTFRTQPEIPFTASGGGINNITVYFLQIVQIKRPNQTINNDYLNMH